MSPRSALAAALLAATAARADGTATTLFDSRPYVRADGYQESPIYESFSLFARKDEAGFVQDLRLVARGWGRLTFGRPFDDQRVAGDVDSLFIEGRVLKRHVLVRLGRQLATAGALRATQFDGAAIRAIALQGFGAEAYGGVPVQPRFSQATGDAITGGRVFWSHSFDSEIGASAVYALRRGYVARKDAGFDASFTPLRQLTLSGIAQWSLEDKRLAEARAAVLWQATRELQVAADVQRTAPDLFLDRSSIFAVFAEQERNEAGGEVVYRFAFPVTVSADWHWLKVEAGHGHRAGARATFRAAEGSYGAELRLLTQPDNGYKQVRLFGTRRLARDFTITLDLDGYWLEREVSAQVANAQKHSLVATASCGWAFDPAWEASLAASFGTTPYFERRAELIARLTWRFGIPFGGFR